MKTQRILEPRDLSKISKAREQVWKAYLGFVAAQIDDGLAEMKMLLNVKRLLDELLVEAKHD